MPETPALATPIHRLHRIYESNVVKGPGMDFYVDPRLLELSQPFRRTFERHLTADGIGYISLATAEIGELAADAPRLVGQPYSPTETVSRDASVVLLNYHQLLLPYHDALRVRDRDTAWYLASSLASLVYSPTGKHKESLAHRAYPIRRYLQLNK